MWCARCQADVAAEVSQDTRTIRCASCGSELVNSLSSRTESRTRQARALLERWSQERETASPDERSQTPVAAGEQEMRQPVEHAAQTETAAAQIRPPFDRPATPGTDRSQPAAGTTHRIDAPHFSYQTKHQPTAPPTAVNPAPAAQPENAEPVSRRPEPMAPVKRITNWASTAGQWLAYAGILGLMSGTCLVILGYFRGPESYAPTGWLITTAGQMLLFLGVVTLVSSGIEESSKTVAEQIGRLDAKLLRIEQATEALRAPHTLPQFERNAENAAPSADRASVKS